MKNNKFATVLISVLIFAIVVILGILAWTWIANARQTGNADIQTPNPEVNELDKVGDGNENNQDENITTDPIINPITPNIDPDGTESIVSTYYYSQLDDTAKAIYDGLKNNKNNLTSGNYIIDYETKFNSLLNTEGGEETLNKAFQSAWDAFSYDNVDLFYIDVKKMTLTSKAETLGGITTYTVTVGPGENTNYFLGNFKSKAEVEIAKNYLEGIKRQMIEQTSSGDAYTKMAKLHNWLIYFINYDNSGASKEQNTIYGALKNGKAVCEGYSRAFKYLVDGMGIPCLLVSGTAKPEEGQSQSHAWNYVQIEQKWYAIDVTWDDPIVEEGVEQTDEMKYKYFLKGSEEFKKDHTEDGHISENGMNFQYPALNMEDYKKQ